MAKHTMRLQEKRLFSNTFFLYLLTFSSQLFSLITVPYLTRVLGPSVYGKTGIAMAYMSYVQIILDFGFILSATQKVVENRENPKELGRILTAVTSAKLMLSMVVGTAFSIYTLCNGTMRVDFRFYFLYLLAYIANALMPDFFYRGIEKMKIITYRAFAIKAVFTVLIFVFVKTAADFWMIPLFTLIGNVVAALVMYMDMAKKYKVYFTLIHPKETFSLVKKSLPFFASRIASTFYQAMNTIIFTFLYGTAPIIGWYTSADKIVSLSKTASSPIADSIYPYMIKEKNYKLIKKILVIVMPIILVGGIGLFILAEPICLWLFGSEFAGTGTILRCLLPIMVVILPTYLLCFPVMVPMGLSKQANFSNIVGTCVQLIGLLVLYLVGVFNMYSICILTSVTECSVFLYRLLTVIKHRDRMVIKPEEAPSAVSE